jgi:hypothetical protein
MPRRAVPAWVDLKDAQSREPSAARDREDARSRGSSPLNFGGRAPNTPSRAGADRIDRVGGVAWASVQCAASPCTSPSPRDHSPSAHVRGAGDGVRSRRSPFGERRSPGIDILSFKLRNLSPNSQLQGRAYGSKDPPSPSRRSPRQRAISQDMACPGLPGSYHVSHGGSASASSQARETPVPQRTSYGASSADRQGSTHRLRRDRESCQRAIAAQFQAPRLGAPMHSHGPTIEDAMAPQ